MSITSATFNGKTVDPVLQADGRYLIRVEGVEAYNLNQVLAIGGTAGDEAFSISARPLDYAGIVLSGDYDGLSKNAMAALYHYYFWSNQVR